MEQISQDFWKSLASRSPDPLDALRGLQRIWERLNESQRAILLTRGKEGLAGLAWLVGASPGLLPFLLRHPEEAILDLFARGRILEESPLEGESRAFFSSCKESRDLVSLTRLVTRFRNLHLVRLYSQEILGLRPCTEIWREWSEVASLCIQGALVGVEESLGEELEGVRMAVLGMGKLGGGELNLCSDIDLLYVYEPVHGRGGFAQAADRLARVVTQVLEGPSDVGPTFRVDLGLRPGGKEGPLAISVEGAEFHYQALGSPWERWALLKAHPVAGDRELGERFLSALEPFVYRTSLDYASLEDIRQMKAKIERESKWRSPDTIDVKMGKGGIRELEFLVQTLQIVHGGKRRPLRVRSTIGALEALASCGILEIDESQTLIDAYKYLRQVEHRVQMVYLRQTHRLPSNERELRRIAVLMGYGDGKGITGMLEELREHMSFVRRAFAGLVAEPRTRREEDEIGERLLARLEEGDEALDAIRQAGFREAASVRRSLERMSSPNFGPSRSPRARRVFHRLLPRMLSEVTKSPFPDQTLFRVERLLEVIGPRAEYLSLLEESPVALERLMRVLSGSAMLSRWLTEHVESLDALVSGHYDKLQKSPGELREEVQRLFWGTRDIEERLGRLRLFRAQEFLRIGVADLCGILHPWQVGEEITKVAEVFLEATLEEVMASRGYPESSHLLPLSVVGLGSLGGKELTYGSDLDLMFVYDEATGWTPRDGSGCSEFLTKLAQRLLSWLSMATKEGKGWSVDVRLRPSGTRGPLLVSLRSFKQYHEGMSESWERQMLLRARHCAGNPEVGQKTMGIIDSIFLRSPPPDPNEVHAMRSRMERERGQAPEGGFHLKLGPGGMADIEFLVQYLQWCNWSKDSRVRTTSTIGALEGLVAIGALPGREAGFLKKAHGFLKGMENRLGLVLEHKATDQPFSAQELAALGRMDDLEWVPASKKGEDLTEKLERVMRNVRRLYLGILLGRRA